MSGTYITTVDDGVLRITELVGDSAVEVARISLRDTRAATITSLVANLIPYLAPAGADKLRAASNGQVPATRRSSRVDKMAKARAYVEAHPGATISAIANDGLGLVGGQGSGFHELLRSAGLRLEQESTGVGRHGYRWRVYPPGEAKRAPATKSQGNPNKGRSQADVAAAIAERKERVLAYVVEHPGTNGSTALRALGLDPRGHGSTALTELAREGRLRKEGQRGDTRWYPA